jgi:hypothetical protein
MFEIVKWVSGLEYITINPFSFKIKQFQPYCKLVHISAYFPVEIFHSM